MKKKRRRCRGKPSLAEYLITGQSSSNPDLQQASRELGPIKALSAERLSETQAERAQDEYRLSLLAGTFGKKDLQTAALSCHRVQEHVSSGSARVSVNAAHYNNNR